MVIVGAGLSGIGAACHLQRECPSKSYAILEGRDAMGGTWDLFRYPGIRSDSDMHTLGYKFKPWRESKAIADGQAILKYIHETATEHDIDRRIRYGHHIVSASWSDDDAQRIRGGAGLVLGVWLATDLRHFATELSAAGFCLVLPLHQFVHRGLRHHDRGRRAEVFHAAR